MKRMLLPASVAVLALAMLTGCGGAPMPTPSSSGTPSASPAPSGSPIPEGDDEETDEVAHLIPPRIDAECDDLISASEREELVGIDADDLDTVVYPLANGSAAELQAGVLTCQWAGPYIAEETSTAIDIEILPDAAAEFAAFVPPLSGSEMLGLLGPGSTVSCYVDAASRSCYLHFLSGAYWVDASFTGTVPTPASDPVTVAVEFAGTIADVLAAAGPLGAAYSPPAGSVPAWASCGVIDAAGGFRAAIASPSLTAPEPEFTGAGTLFSEAWQRVDFKSCTWRQADVFSSPVGQIRMVTVGILPGGEWAWQSLREAFADRGATEIPVAGADEAMVLCFDDDNCTIEALVRGSYVYVTLSLDQYRAGAQALAKTAAEFAIARV